MHYKNRAWIENRAVAVTHEWNVWRTCSICVCMFLVVLRCKIVKLMRGHRTHNQNKKNDASLSLCVIYSHQHLWRLYCLLLEIPLCYSFFDSTDIALCAFVCMCASNNIFFSTRTTPGITMKRKLVPQIEENGAIKRRGMYKQFLVSDTLKQITEWKLKLKLKQVNWAKENNTNGNPIESLTENGWPKRWCVLTHKWWYKSNGISILFHLVNDTDMSLVWYDVLCIEMDGNAKTIYIISLLLRSMDNNNLIEFISHDNILTAYWNASREFWNHIASCTCLCCDVMCWLMWFILYALAFACFPVRYNVSSFMWLNFFFINSIDWSFGRSRSRLQFISCNSSSSTTLTAMVILFIYNLMMRIKK